MASSHGDEQQPRGSRDERVAAAVRWAGVGAEATNLVAEVCDWELVGTPASVFGLCAVGTVCLRLWSAWRHRGGSSDNDTGESGMPSPS